MRKIVVMGMMMLAGITASAQDYERGIFNHLGANLSVGTEGIGIGVASPLTDYLEVGLGINFLPSIKVDGNVDVNFSLPVAGYEMYSSDKVKLTGDFARTTMDFKVNVYPFGGNSLFFVSGGFSFLGEKMAKLTGHSDVIQSAIRTNPELKDLFYAELDKYEIKFDQNGDVKGDIRVKKFRPYVGLGVGRLIPKNRVGFRFELGCQFMGKMEVYQNNKVVDINEYNDKDDDLSKIVDKLKVYPVLKFTLTTRIF